MERSCPSDAELVELIEGALDAAAATAVDEHLDGCAACRRVVAELGRSLTVAATPRAAASSAPPAPATGLGRGAAVSRYIVLDKLGSGGMGVVFAAYDPELDRKIALKVLRADLGGLREQVQSRLLREARAMALLSHPNVITVHDVGSFGDDVFVAMELVVGETLAAHLGRKRLPAGEILDLFARAGAGLAAAHAAGLVHRDFKPDNVLIGEDGRVRVTDFGLVRRASAEAFHGSAASGSTPQAPAERSPDGATPVAASDGVATTHAGARIGTPAYMAPEQHQGRVADARSDQFSFCVALHEALHGERPFAGGTALELAAAVTAGQIREPPGAAVPARIRPILRRGLSVRPEDRFPTMDALLGALQQAQARRGPRIALSLLGILVASILAVALLRSPALSAAPPPCRDAAAGLARAWNDARRARVAEAFHATGKLFAADGAREVARELDAYADSWTAARIEACEATRVRGEQSEKMLDLVAGCLDRRARSMETLVSILEQASPDLVARGVDVVRAMPRIDRCAPGALATPVARPISPEAQARVADAEARLAEAQAMLAAGELTDLEAMAPRIVEQARAAGYAPLVAEALGVLADAQEANEHNAASEATLYEALWAAEAGHDDLQGAWAWSQLVFVVGIKQHRLAEAERLARHAEAALARLGGDTQLETKLALYRGDLAFDAGALDLAEARLQEALELSSRMRPDDGKWMAEVLSRRALVEIQRDELTRALSTVGQTLALTERAYGPVHPRVAETLGLSALVYESLGRYDEALTETRRRLDIQIANLAENSPAIAVTRSNLAWSLRSVGRPEEALEEADLAVHQATESLGTPDVWMGLIRAERARSLLALGRVREAILEARAALALCVNDKGPPAPEAWDCRNALAAALQAGHDLPGAYAQYRALADQSGSVIIPDQLVVAAGLTGMGRCEIAEGRPGPAVSHLERALAIREAREGDPVDLADTRLALAEALSRTGGDRARSVDLARKARDAYAASGTAKLAELSAAEAWLAAHPAPPG